ncbi:MAG TPA: purine-nucleoside phosphorylase [Feifaniaceae bacterium]|nr:purine-nucleoside phosphorylase [Feifaniaceae bacterium]
MPAPTIHNAAQKGDIAPTVLMPGDPLRAKFVADTFLENVAEYNSVRNMLGYTGYYKGRRISVQGSGMGIPSIALYAYELYNFYDVENIIRIGSTGAWADALGLRELVVAIGACTDSNFQHQYKLPGTFAPVASFPLLEKAVALLRERSLPFTVGSVYSSDVFYRANKEDKEKWVRMGVVSVDMETAGLYTVAAESGKNALSLLTVSDKPGEKLTAEERNNSLLSMIEAALDI